MEGDLRLLLLCFGHFAGNVDVILRILRLRTTERDGTLIN